MQGLMADWDYYQLYRKDFTLLTVGLLCKIQSDLGFWFKLIATNNIANVSA